MSKLLIFEPAMCCSTGVCGVGVDTELLRISTVINALKEKGIEIERYNLSNNPQAFIDNQVINAFINDKGVDELPAIIVDNTIVVTGRYPTNEEIAKYLEVPMEALEEEKDCCSGDCCSEDCCC